MSHQMETLGSESSRSVIFPAGSKKRIAEPKLEETIFYPDSDGKPMADNTRQFNWIVKIKENLEIMFADRPDVFVAGDLLWYPVEGDNKIRAAPDTMVAFNRPKGYRGSYRQWEEDNIAPQVVFEILSPGNTSKEMKKKLGFYDKYGVEEYYLYDPDNIEFTGWIRKGKRLCLVENVNGWTSPALKIRFEITGTDLDIYAPDGTRFKYLWKEVKEQRQRAEKEKRRADMLEAKLKELGISLD